MSIKLLASIPEDGYAIVSEADSVFLLRPPYDHASRVALLPNDVRDAVTKHAFIAETAAFANYADLIGYLEQQIERSREESGIPLPQKTPLIDALSLAPPEVIREFLHRTEHELVPTGKWDHAEDILINILAARKEDDFRNLAMEVRGKLLSAKQQSQSWQPHDARFKTPETEACKTISQLIKQSRRILQPA